MITVHWYEKEDDKQEWEYEFYGLSTDPKPQNKKIAINSILFELDTGDFYYLKSQATSSTPAVWEKIGGGSSGGSSLVGTAVVGTAVVGG